MEIIHDLSRKQFQTVADGKTAYVSYDLVDGCLNIEHTIVPREIEGRGTVWLDRNPQYKDKVSSMK